MQTGAALDPCGFELCAYVGQDRDQVLVEELNRGSVLRPENADLGSDKQNVALVFATEIAPIGGQASTPRRFLSVIFPVLKSLDFIRATSKRMPTYAMQADALIPFSESDTVVLRGIEDVATIRSCLFPRELIRPQHEPI